MYMHPSLIEYKYENEESLRSFLQDEKWSDPHHLARLYRYAKSEIPKEGLILEIGCNFGESTIVMGHAIRGSKKHIVTIDPVFRFPELLVPDDQNPGGNVYNAPLLSVMDEISSHHLDGYISIIPQYSWEAIKNWDGREIDMLFIDGEHTYEGVKKDCAWLSHVKKGGLVLFDDWYPPIERGAKEKMAEMGGWQMIEQARAIVFRRE